MSEKLWLSNWTLSPVDTTNVNVDCWLRTDSAAEQSLHAYKTGDIDTFGWDNGHPVAPSKFFKHSWRLPKAALNRQTGISGYVFAVDGSQLVLSFGSRWFRPSHHVQTEDEIDAMLKIV